jgi:polar amino acid transport system substrate-binding protein
MSRYPARARFLAAAVAVVTVGALSACSSADSGTGSESSSGYITDGKFTVATGEPAYFPYVIDDAPETGEGFEAAVAYAVADELGFGKDDVEWVRTTFDDAIAPGPKTFDVNLQQFTIDESRAQSVDFSSPYFSTPQAVVTVADSPAADATSIADLEGYLIGAASGTTSFTTIEDVIKPSSGAQAFNSNDDAKLALENGTVDAIVVDLPTAFYLTGVELTDGVLVGQLPLSGIADEWGFVLEKDSPLTDDVSDAVDALRESGKLQQITDEWLEAGAGAPVLQ